ncbi:MAG: thioredoxin family protein [Bacteroidetes bacterium]|nr:thioredoxin family protein [Bacteroidota bacterium]
MKRLFLLILLIASVSITYGQEKNKIVTDPKKNKPMLVGSCSMNAIKKDSFKIWYDKEYIDYKVDTKTLDQLKGQWRDVTITIVMGTWCGDSRREVPRFYKILEYAKFKKKRMKVICVDREKKAADIDISQLNIQYVPTIIIYRGGAEMGRIIESPKETLEKDLSRFVGLAENK